METTVKIIALLGSLIVIALCGVFRVAKVFIPKLRGINHEAR